MRTALALILVVATSSAAFSQYNNRNYGYGTGSNPSSGYVQGYSRSDGTYVQPHYRTNPNNTQLDNYSTSGNYNPYTGKTGHRSVLDD